MDQKKIMANLPGTLLPWYDGNKRDLPWRADREPYHVWISEIMLQQTRVEAVKGYYARFLAALPTVEDLANADTELLNKLWEGLGYYSRVRNLQKAAIEICSQGGFPGKYEDVLALPGIGEYTAGAICSICFDQPTPAVDGNVLRVVSRLTNDPTPIDQSAYKKQVRDALAEIYPARAGDFTQALMELGATLCGPNRKPRCGECPCREFCRGHLMGTAEELPVKSPKKGKRVEEYTVFILSRDGSFGLSKRPYSGLLAGLWQFPNVAGILEPEAALRVLEDIGLQPRNILRQSERYHIFTHIRWNMRGFWVEVAGDGAGITWLSPEEINRDAALPTAFRQFWEETKEY